MEKHWWRVIAGLLLIAAPGFAVFSLAGDVTVHSAYGSRATSEAKHTVRELPQDGR